MRLCLCPALPDLSHGTQPAPRDPAKLCGSVLVLLDFWAGLWLPLRLGSEGAQDPLRCHGVPQKSNKSKNSLGISLWKVFRKRKPRAETSREPQDLPPPPPCFASSLLVAARWLSGASTATGQHYRSSRQGSVASAQGDVDLDHDFMSREGEKVQCVCQLSVLQKENRKDNNEKIRKRGKSRSGATT